MNINPAAIANNSTGTQINRFLDALGLPDSIGDSIGALVDTRTGNAAGAMRNLIDLNSGLSTRQMDSIFGGGRRPSFGRAFAARRSPFGPHLHRFGSTYTHREQVGKRAHIGQRYGMNWGPFHATGRITGGQYAGSFAKPVRLGDGDYLFRGRKYDNLGDIYKDARDGRVDGFATHRHYRPGIARPFPFPGMFRGIGSAANGINDIIGRIFDAIGANKPGNTAGGTGSTGGNGSTGNTGSTGGASNGGSVLNDPNMSLEDKLALLMSKLSEHLDKQINDKMKSIENQMAKEKSGNSSNGAKKSGKSGGGLFSSIGKLFGSAGRILGGAAGTVFGGPLGGMLGSGLGGKLGSALGGIFGGGGSSAASSAGSSNGSNGTGSTGGSGNGQDSNLQLLQTQLQQLLQKRQQMFQTMSNVVKSLHDTSMNTIRQLKA